MTWWGGLIFAAYWVGYLVALPRIAYILAWDFGRPDGADVAFAYAIGFMVALIWPICFVGYRWYLHAKGRNFSGLLVPPRPIRQKQERQQLQQRISDLERELQIR